MVHQSVFELVHSEDREELQRQLHWNSFLTPDQATIPLQVIITIIDFILLLLIVIVFITIIIMFSISFFQEILLPENSHLLERSFTVRFRCLLDNTSGFLVSQCFIVTNCIRKPNNKNEDLTI